MTEPPRRRVVDRQSRPVTDPAMNARAQRMLNDAMDRYDAKQNIGHGRTRAWLIDYGMFAVAVLCAFLAGFVAGATWQLMQPPPAAAAAVNDGH